MESQITTQPEDDDQVMAPPLLVVPGVASPVQMAVSLAGRPWRPVNKTAVPLRRFDQE